MTTTVILVNEQSLDAIRDNLGAPDNAPWRKTDEPMISVWTRLQKCGYGRYLLRVDANTVAVGVRDDGVNYDQLDIVLGIALCEPRAADLPFVEVNVVTGKQSVCLKRWWIPGGFPGDDTAWCELKVHGLDVSTEAVIAGLRKLGFAGVWNERQRAVIVTNPSGSLVATGEMIERRLSMSGGSSHLVNRLSKIGV